MLTSLKVRLMRLLVRAREGLWLIPSVMVIAALVAGVFVPYIDVWLARRDSEGPWQALFYDAGADGARALLAAIAGSSITVAATVFSITIATLALTSQQFGPRLLRTFLADRVVQFSLGTFLAAFIYPLLVLRVVDGTGDQKFVPGLSITLAVLLGLMAVGVLIFFIDHVATMIRAPQIIDTIGDELDAVIDDRIPADGSCGDTDEDADDMRSPDLPSADGTVVATSVESGYITYVDEEALVRIASRCGGCLRMRAHVGSYTHEGGPLVIADKPECFEDDDRQAIRRAFGVGPHRTLQQDVSHGVNQLVELAQRAMSPGINDPFTAQTCVDRIAAALARIADRPFPDPRLRDDDGSVRLLLRRPTFAYLVSIGFSPIRRYARRDAALLGRMTQTLAAIARRIPRDRASRLAALRTEVGAIDRAGRELDELDRRALEREIADFHQAAGGRPAGGGPP